MAYIILATLFYTGAIMLGAFASRLINSNLVTAIVNVVSVVIPMIVILPLLNRQIFESNKFGIVAAIGGGVCIALFGLFLNKSFQAHKIALVSPIVFGGMIFLTTILSYFIFKEKLSPLHTTGIVIVGIGLLTIIYSAVTNK